jgi:hypothetical protein
MAAARAWAAGSLDQRPEDRPPPDDEVILEARRFGIDGAALDHLRQQLRLGPASGFSGVLRVNGPVVAAFLAGASQWRTASIATRRGAVTVFIGLDYAGVRVALEALAIAITPALWAGLVTMEQAARAALNGEPA